MLLVMVAAWGVIGCGAPSPPKTEAKSDAPQEKPLTPEEARYEQVRSAWVLLEGASASLEDAYTEAKSAAQRAKSSLARQAMTEILDLVDSAGTTMAELDQTPPTPEMVLGDPQAYEKKRGGATTALTDAIFDLREAMGIVAGLNDLPSPDRELLDRLNQTINVAVHDLGDALVQLGGPVEPEADR